MGSTLENAIVMSIVLTVLVILVTGPEDISLRTLDDCRYGMEEIEFMTGDSDVIRNKSIHKVQVTDTSPERMCTFLQGLSDNYRLIYQSGEDLLGGD